jgi:glycosyltransferase involved in cell wall biosynthesis
VLAEAKAPAGPAPRIVFVVGLASGGTARHVSALADGCRTAGLDVSVAGPARTLARLSAGTDTLAVAIGDRPNPARDIAAIVRLRTWLAGKQADVVHGHGVRAGAFAAVAIAGLPGRARPALAVTVHNAPPDGAFARLGYGLLERICARRADLVLCVSADLLARMRRLGPAAAERFDVPAPQGPAPTAADVAAARADVAGSRSDVAAAPSGVAGSRSGAGAAAYGAGAAASGVGADGRPLVLAVARLAHQKGLDVLIDAAVRWRNRDPRPRTVIAGDGPLAGELRRRASEAGADVAFLGPREDVPALLAAADVVVVPSRWEARALIVQEAMRSGRPIVATRAGGTPELTGADGALLVPPGDAAALAAGVIAVLDDESLAARLSHAAQARSAAFPSEQDAVRSLLASYARLAASRAGGRGAVRAG